MVLGVVTSYYVSRTKNKIDRIHKKLICPEHFTDNIGKKILLFCSETMTFQQDDLFKKDNSFGTAVGFVAEIHGSFPRKAPTGSQSFVASEFSFQPE